MKKIMKILVVGIIWTVILGSIAYSYTVSSFLNPAMALFLKGDYYEALQECIRIEKGGLTLAQRSEVLYLEGMCFFKLNQFEQARVLFKKALIGVKSDFSLELYMGIADAYFMQDAFSQAIAIYEQLLSKYKNNQDYLAMLYYKLGKSCQKNSEWVKSEYYFNRLSKEFPQSFESELSRRSDSGGSFFTIQVGCFTSQKNARKLYDDLKAKGYEVYMSEYNLNGKNLYRIRVGKFISRIAAEYAEKDLKTRERLPTHIFP